MRITKRILLVMLLLMLPSCSEVIFAGTVARYFDYSPGDSVTDVNLDGNFNNIINELNSGLDNDNSDTVNGYRFIQILGTLPAAGTQGRVVFQTSDNSLYFDTGSAWRQVITPSSAAVQGDTVYFGGTTWDTLPKNTSATRYLSNTGGSNNPAWAQINLANGITIASQATGDLLYASSGSAWTRLGVGSNGQVLKLAAGLPAWSTASNINIYTSTGSNTFTAPASITKVYLTMVGGGGGGGGVNTGDVGAGGGGGGGIVLNYPYTVIAGNNYTCSVGAGGAGGTAGDNDGSVGTATTFDSTVSASGGSGGSKGSVATGGAGGGGLNGIAGGAEGSAPAGGGYNIAGGTGGAGGASSDGGSGGGTIAGAGGAGGDGAGGGAVGGNASANTGGGGGGAGGQGVNKAGGDGGSGICIVMY